MIDRRLSEETMVSPTESHERAIVIVDRIRSPMLILLLWVSTQLQTSRKVCMMGADGGWLSASDGAMGLPCTCFDPYDFMGTRSCLASERVVLFVVSPLLQAGSKQISIGVWTFLNTYPHLLSHTCKPALSPIFLMASRCVNSHPRLLGCFTHHLTAS